ncbi:hypothetical protein B0A48_10830 [Cryoendolithus antarcticus]|uniref:Uncharacterized protein n=1 Tax=Cryoendolithus antarcticus TaxID=1507870 RepID=A0A1V8SYT2_9PEZI|nr:hypothetical protein B0A48_10830 [Cryoendolithus antarcticus]
MESRQGIQVGSLDASDHANVNVGDTHYQSESQTARDSYGNVTNLYQVNQYFTGPANAARRPQQPTGRYWAPSAAPRPGHNAALSPFARPPSGFTPVGSLAPRPRSTPPPAQYLQPKVPGRQRSPLSANMPPSSPLASSAAAPQVEGSTIPTDLTLEDSLIQATATEDTRPRVPVVGRHNQANAFVGAFAAQGLNKFAVRRVTDRAAHDEWMCVAMVANELQRTSLTEALKLCKARYPMALRRLYRKLVMEERGSKFSEEYLQEL